MHVDWTEITGGALISIVFNALTVFAAVVCFYYASKFHNKLLGEKLNILGGRMINVENKVDGITKVLVEQAEMRSEINATNQRVTGNENRIERIERVLDRREK